MAEVRLRPKGQLTIPAAIIEEAKLPEDATFEIAFVGGVITLTPRVKDKKKDDIMSYAGIFKGAWGKTDEEIEKTIRDLHNEWER
jgi:bifunctional DNA-binding transcriptional regulator/antitoxin component of YhaV-PrlF toxin-antitoxin module